MTNQQSECAPSEDSDQPGHPPSLFRVFAVRMKKACVLTYPLSAQQRLPRPIWVFAGRKLTLLVLSCRGTYSGVQHYSQKQIFFNNTNCAKLKSATFTAKIWKIWAPEQLLYFVKMWTIRFCHQSNACKLNDKQCRLWSGFGSNLVWVYNACPDLTVWKNKDHYGI